MNVLGRSEIPNLAGENMRKIKAMWLLATLTFLVGIAIFIWTLQSPTPAPSSKSTDYLAVVRALDPIRNRVESQLNSSSAVRNTSSTELKQAIGSSSNHIRSVIVHPDGVIETQVTVGADGSKTSGTDGTLVLRPKFSAGAYEWDCYSRPRDIFPSFCRPLQ